MIKLWIFYHDKITKGFDSGLLNGMILFDLQKVFDTIDQNILIKKKKHVPGFNDETIKWSHYISQIESLLSVWKTQTGINHP